MSTGTSTRRVLPVIVLAILLVLASLVLARTPSLHGGVVPIPGTTLEHQADSTV